MVNIENELGDWIDSCVKKYERTLEEGKTVSVLVAYDNNQGRFSLGLALDAIDSIKECAISILVGKHKYSLRYKSVPARKKYLDEYIKVTLQKK